MKKIKLTHLIENNYSVENITGRPLGNIWREIPDPVFHEWCRIERKDLFGISFVFLFIEAADLWVEYKLHLLPIPLAKLDNVKKIYASIVFDATCEKWIT